MASSFVSCFVHYIFSTKRREPVIASAMRPRLWSYIAGTMRNHKMKALAIGGTADHVHILASLPSTLSIAQGIQLIKANSSRWVHDTYPGLSYFAWRTGYGAFSIGLSRVSATITYIENQQDHHRTRSFKEEYITFLEKHGIEYDPRYVCG